MSVTETPATCRITWWVWAGGEKMRHTANMRGTWGYDASCSCGWESRTGGATRGSVQRDVDDHKYNVTGEHPAITRLSASFDRLNASTAALLAELDAR